jgi:hypothetical protein
MKAKKSVAALARCFSLAVCACVIQAVAMAQSWVPFVGTQEVTIYKLLPVGKQVVSQTRSVYMRNLDGSVYTRNLPVRGLPADANLGARLMDARTGKTYTISYANKSATLVHAISDAGSLPMRPSTSAAPKGGVPLGEKVVGGVQCVGWRIVESLGRTQEIWRASSLNNFPVSAKITDTVQQEEVDLNMVSIEPGTVPEAQYFQIPKDFTVR